MGGKILFLGKWETTKFIYVFILFGGEESLINIKNLSLQPLPKITTLLIEKICSNFEIFVFMIY